LKIKPFVAPEIQECRIGNHRWSVARLFQLSKDLSVMEIPIAHLNIHFMYGKMSLRELAGHAVAIRDADLRCPIILDEDGELMDGRHRLMKSIIEGATTIKAVRFDENPEPCKWEK